MNKQGEGGGTAVNSAAVHGHHQCLRVLILVGANVNAIDHEGNSVLHKLLQPFINQENVTCLRLVLAAGANVNIRNQRCKTADVDILRWNNNDRLKTDSRIAILKLCFIAGEYVGDAEEEMREKLSEGESELWLQQLCRDAIIRYILYVNPHQNLFVRVPRLGLPAAIKQYIMYYVSLKAETDALQKK